MHFLGTGSQPSINSNPAEIKKEPDDIKPCLPLDAVVKEENTTNNVKQVNKNSSFEQSDSNNTRNFFL